MDKLCMTCILVKKKETQVLFVEHMKDYMHMHRFYKPTLCSMFILQGISFLESFLGCNNGVKAITALCPPKPNELEIAITNKE